MDVCFFTLAYFKNKQKCEVVVIRSAGLSTKQQQGFIHPFFTPLVDVDGMKKKYIFYYYILLLLLCGCFVIGLSPCLCCCVYRKVVRSTWSSERSPWAGACLYVSQWLFTRLFLFSVHPAAWLKSVTPSCGLQVCPWRHHMTQGLMSW